MPSWALGLAVAALTLPVGFGIPFGGVDGSWMAALYMAAQEGLDFGTEIVYTFGPLGFLQHPVLFYDGLAIAAVLFSSAVWVATCVALVAALRRSIGAPAAVVVAFAALALMATLEQPLILVCALGLLALRPDPPARIVPILAVGGGLFAAIEVLVKLSVGPVVVVLLLVALLGAAAPRLWIAGFAGIFVAGTLVLWLATGGALDALPDYVSNGREIVSGYSDTFANPFGPAWQRIALVVTAVAVVAMAAMGEYANRRARVAGVALVALVAFSIYKEGIVRSDEGHLNIAFATIVLLALIVPWRRSLMPLMAGGAAALAAVALAVQSDPATDRLSPLNGVDATAETVEYLFSPGLRDERRELGREFLLDTYLLDSAMLADLEGRTVFVDPWEASATWAYDLDWLPPPVFQGYQAYTTELDELNAESIASPEGPDRILRENPAAVEDPNLTRGVDSHYPGWDPPQQSVATLCNFTPLRTTERWQVLGRVPDRCGEPRPLSSAEAAAGETVEVPVASPGEVVLVEIHGAGVDGLERLRSLLFRAAPRYVNLDGSASYRLVPGTAADGLLLAGAPAIVGSGPWEQAPNAESMTVVGIGGEIRYEFLAMSVDTGGREA